MRLIIFFSRLLSTFFQGQHVNFENRFEVDHRSHHNKQTERHTFYPFVPYLKSNHTMDRITASGRPSRARNAHLPPGQNFDDIECAFSPPCLFPFASFNPPPPLHLFAPATQTHISTVALLLYAHGDVPPIRRISTKRDDIVPAIAETAKVLDELISGFIVESCIQMSRSAALHGRKKIKVDDIRYVSFSSFQIFVFHFNFPALIEGLNVK